MKKLLWVAILACASSGVTVRANPATDLGISQCAVALRPEITLINSSSSLKASWLQLVTENTYESAKLAIKSSGDANLLGLIGANGEFSYDQFNDKRREYLSKNSGSIDEQHAFSLFKQSLPAGAEETFLGCVKIVMSVPGLHAWFSDESADSTLLHVQFVGTAGTNLEYTASVQGGTGMSSPLSIVSGGDDKYDIKRTKNAPEVRVTLRSKSPPGALSDFAVSVRPNSTISRPTPKLISEAVWSAAVAAQPTTCNFMIANKELKVTAFDLSASDSVTMTVKGNHVLPAAGKYPLQPANPSSYPVLASRSMDDFEVGPSSEITLVGPNGASALLVKTAATVPNCHSYSLKFSMAKVDVRSPSPVYVVSDTIVTETHDYKTGGDYHQWNATYGCPGNCGNLFYADLTQKLTRPVGRYVAVRLLAQVGNPQWYRCYAVTPVCGTAGEFTPVADPTSRLGSCNGYQTCVAWRFSTAGDANTDTIEVQYQPLVCARYCPP
jgi:hypothetical protein